MLNSEQLTPREYVLLEHEKEEARLSREHAVEMKKMELEGRRIELFARQEEAVKSRQHSEAMKELELAIRQTEIKWQQMLRIPILIIKLPVLVLFGVAYIVSACCKRPIESREFWSFLR